MNKNSRMETIFRSLALKEGFLLFSKGWPDYVISKNGKTIFVECKRPVLRKTPKEGFSAHQLNMKILLEGLGLNYKIFRGDAEDFKKW